MSGKKGRLSFVALGAVLRPIGSWDKYFSQSPCILVRIMFSVFLLSKRMFVLSPFKYFCLILVGFLVTAPSQNRIDIQQT